jgi:hypothetical protein
MEAVVKRKSLFHSMHDYELTQRYIPFLAGIAIAGHLAFGAIRRVFGYWESWPLRIFVVLLALPLLSYPTEKALSLKQKLYWEFSVMVICPLTLFFFAFMNEFNIYWSLALIFVVSFMA